MMLLQWIPIVFVLTTGSVLGQIDIEIYDADVFAAKTHPSVYSANVYPKQEKPVLVNVSLFLDHFGPYDELKSEFSMALQVHLSWFDERLAFTPNSTNSTLLRVHHFEADQIHLLKIWRPSIYFSNPNMLSPDLLSDKSNGQIMGKIMANGKVHIVKRTTLIGSCKVNIKLYPVDLQQCSIQLESANSDRQLHLQWVSVKSIVLSEDFNWGNFDWLDYALLNSRVSYLLVGPFSRLEAIFILRRQLGYFLLDVYLPTALFVISSWVSFWINIPAAPARVALVLTTMLSHVTSTKSIHEKHPRVSFIHSLDVWVMVCTMFIFASLVEYATANYFFHKQDRNKDRKGNKASVKVEDIGEETLSTQLDGSDSCERSENGTQQKKRWSRKVAKKLSPVAGLWTRVLQWTIPPYDQHIDPRRTALEIDRKARFIFPISFLVFNVLYWSILLYYSYRTHDAFE